MAEEPAVGNTRGPGGGGRGRFQAGPDPTLRETLQVHLAPGAEQVEGGCLASMMHAVKQIAGYCALGAVPCGNRGCCHNSPDRRALI